MMKIVETDNFDGDYPDEAFLNLPPMGEAAAKAIAEEINHQLNLYGVCPRYWKVVADNYKLAEGFEP